MTSETQYRMTFQDIIGLRFTCKECKTVISLPITQKYAPTTCPTCDDFHWFDRQGGEYAQLLEFMSAIRNFQKRSDGAACAIEMATKKPI